MLEWIKSLFSKEDEKFEEDRLTINPKEVVLFRFPDEMSETEVVTAAQRIAGTINSEKEEYKNAVLILQQGMDLETISIEELENILHHAKSIQRESKEEKLELSDEVMEGLNDLIPKEMRG